MTDRLRTWDKICNAGWPTLLVGNGLSINFWSSFSYKRLLEQAELNQAARQLFNDFGTTNFEVVLEALWHAERTLAALGRSTTAVNNLYRHVQNQLMAEIRRVHVPWEVVPAQALTKLASALSAHRMVFTLNYDLLTYWAVMAANQSESFGDFFWSHQNTFSPADCALSPTRTGLVYSHGGVHLWQDSVSGYTGKWTRQSGGRLLSTLARAFDNMPNRQPLIVSEGTSAQKMAVIRRSDYLSFARRCLINDVDNTVIFGVSFGTQDAHIIDALAAGPTRRFAISVLPGSEAHNVATMAHYRSRLAEHKLLFFDSRTHPLGDSSLSIGE
jgi:hypothetical protein